MINFICILIGGGIGATCRAWITDMCEKFINTKFPVATLLINIFGSFLGGYFAGLALHQEWLSTFLIVGILGGFTTFSTLSLELVQMLVSKHNGVQFVVYTLMQYMGAFIGCVLGYTLLA